MKYLKISLGLAMLLALSLLTRPGQNFVIMVPVACAIGDLPNSCQSEVDYAVNDLKKGNLF